MGIGLAVFNAQYAALTEARASIRIGKKQLDRCLCGSFATTRTDTEEGAYEAVVASVKAVKTEWEAAFGKGSPNGLKADFARAGSGEWKSVRLLAASETDGIMSLSLEAEFA